MSYNKCQSQTTSNITEKEKPDSYNQFHFSKRKKYQHMKDRKSQKGNPLLMFFLEVAASLLMPFAVLYTAINSSAAS